MYYIQNISRGDGVVVINGKPLTLGQGKTMSSPIKPSSTTAQIKVVFVPDNPPAKKVVPTPVRATTDSGRKSDSSSNTAPAADKQPAPVKKADEKKE